MNVNIYDMVWSIINFLVLVVILNKFLYKPLLGMLEARKQEIRNKYEQAESARSEAQQLKEQYAQEMQNVRKEAQELLNKATKLGEDSKEELIKEARDEAAKMTRRAQEEIRLEKDRAKQELRNEVASLAVMAAGKIVERAIQQEDHEKLIREFVDEVGDVS